MTELYDAEHNISRGDDDLDRARAGALLAAEQRGSGWGRPSDSDGNPRYDEIIDLLMNQVGRMLDELSVELGSHENKPPAASNEFIDELVEFYPCEEDLAEGAECPVCMAKFEELDLTHELPCSHLFHVDCLLPWLRQANTCPLCREELPSDDPQYEERRLRQQDQVESEARIEELHDSMFG